MRALRCAAVAALVAALGCSSGGSNSDAAGGSSGGSSAGGGGSGGATGGAGGGATNATCQGIRICALDCPDDACILNNCKPMATSDAQTAFQALFDCTVDPARGNCSSYSDINCMCTAQYLQDPPCIDQVTACIGTITNDTIADRCH